ncbi:MAG: o-succinylbenzoate--CoA ligase [Ignavibacteriaceae bacterium]
MKLPESSYTPFTHLTEFNEDFFLIVHRALVEKSELGNLSVIENVERSGDFFSFTYKHIFNTVALIEEKMVAAGLANQKLVPILTSNPFDLILSILGLWSTRAIPVPLNIHLLRKDLEEQITFLKAEDIICETSFTENFPSLKKFSFPKTSLANKKVTTELNMSDTAVVLFTSGTGGRPKGIPLNFTNLVAAFKAGTTILNYAKNDSWYLNLPLYHIGGFSILVRAILAGSRIIIPESNELASLKINMEKVKPTIVSLVPTQLKRICENKIQPNKEMRAALIGGGFSNETVLSQASALGWNNYKVYGSTETAAFITALTPVDLQKKTKSVGKPLDGVEIKIFDEQKNPLPINEVGEIGIIAPSVLKEYLHNEEVSNSSFHNTYYLTGDFGYLDSDGYLYLENRRTDLIVSGGENISPIEIENVISQFENIDEVCVFGLPDNEWGEVVSVAVSARNKREVNIHALKIFLKEKLPSFKIPKKYFQVEEFPKSAIGKIKRAEIKELFKGVVSSHT